MPKKQEDEAFRSCFLSGKMPQCISGSWTQLSLRWQERGKSLSGYFRRGRPHLFWSGRFDGLCFLYI